MLAAAAPAGAQDVDLRPWTGATPALAGRGLAGERRALADLRGRVVLVAFWASWCEPCAEEVPALARLRDAHAAAGRPLEVLLVNVREGPERAAAFLRDHGASGLPVLLDRDGRAAKAWGVGGVPMSFLVDARGRARWSAFGACDWSGGEPARVLARLLAAAARPAGGGAGGSSALPRAR